MLSKLNSSCLPNELKIREEECKELRSAWHYLVTTKNVKCVEITRDFLKSHKKLVGTLANLTDETGRKAIHVALLAPVATTWLAVTPNRVKVMQQASYRSHLTILSSRDNLAQVHMWKFVCKCAILAIC